MFYSHEILTDRKYGMATVWLVATLGSRSYSRKVSKKDILRVNVPKTCELLINPEVPMALRLQSNLLAGICRTYSQQCSYALKDAESIQVDMRRLIRTMRGDDNYTDPEAGKIARPEQLLQADDPNFLPAMLGLGDLPALDIDPLTEPSTQSESVLSSHSRPSSRSSLIQIPELEIPSSSFMGGGMDLGAEPSEIASRAGAPVHIRADDDVIDDDALLPEPDFTFDPDGNMFEIRAREPSAGEHETVPTQPLMGPLRFPSRHASREGSVASPHESLERPRDEAQDQEPPQVDFDVPPDGAQQPPPGVEPSSSQLSPPQLQPSSSHHTPSSSSSEVVAPQRRRRAAKAIPLDTRTELHNSELLAWQNNYVSRMAKIKSNRNIQPSAALARRNADWFTFGGGIAGIGFEVARFGPGHPLAAFAGQSLYDMLVEDGSTSKRNSASAELEEDEDGERRVRPRSEEHGRRGDEEGPTLFDTELEEEDREIEHGRHAPAPLEDTGPSDDEQSTMPWNVPLPSRLSSHSLSGMQPARLSQQLARLDRGSRSRLTSASPLLARALRGSRQGSLLPDLPPGVSSSAAGDNAGIWDDDQGDAPEPAETAEMGDATQLELFGPATQVSTQIANSSQFIRQALDTESVNFSSFLAKMLTTSSVDVDLATVHQTPDDIGTGENGMTKAVTFAQLLPSEENNHVVAAQGLLHSLALATRGLAWMRQDGWDEEKREWRFDGNIWLGAEVVEGLEEGESADGEAGEEPEVQGSEGHVEAEKDIGEDELASGM